MATNITRPHTVKFFFCGSPKNVVYKRKLNSIEELKTVLEQNATKFLKKLNTNSVQQEFIDHLGV